MKKTSLIIFCFFSMFSLSIAQDQSGVPADLALFANPNGPADFVYKGLQFHSDQKVDGVIAPIEVNGRNGRTINSYAYSYKRVDIDATKSAEVNFSKEAGPIGDLQLDVAFQAGISENQIWKQTTNAQQGIYRSENSLDANAVAILIGEIEPTPLTRKLDAAGLLAQNNAPIFVSDIRSHDNLTYSGKEINDIESSSNFMSAAATASASLTFRGNPLVSIQRDLLEKSQQQSANARFLYNTKLTKDSDSHLQSGIFLTTDSLMWPSYVNLSLASSLDNNLISHGTGVADISYAQSKTTNPTQKHPIPVYEGRDRYVGDFEINRKLHMNSVLNDWSLGEGIGNYDWLPCSCNAGWFDMTIHDQKYHSAKGFFDCTTCWPGAPCTNETYPTTGTPTRSGYNEFPNPAQ